MELDERDMNVSTVTKGNPYDNCQNVTKSQNSQPDGKVWGLAIIIISFWMYTNVYINISWQSMQ